MATYNVQIEDSAGNKYHPKPDLLTTKEQLAANTAAGKSADALVVKDIYNNLMSHPQFIYDTSGKITGYKTKGGADTVFPFSSDFRITVKLKLVQNGTTYNGTITITYKDGTLSYTASKGTKHVIGVAKQSTVTWLEMNVHIVDVTFELL